MVWMFKRRTPEAEIKAKIVLPESVYSWFRDQAVAASVTPEEVICQALQDLHKEALAPAPKRRHRREAGTPEPKHVPVG